MQQNTKTVALGDISAIPHKSGYLFERKHGRVYQSWSRKYYNIFDGELICTTRNPKVRAKKKGSEYFFIDHFD
jgi:hypothetical protein